MLDWKVLTDADPTAPLSGTKQKEINKVIDEKAASFISGELLEKISTVLSPVCSVKADEKDPHILHVAYPESFSDQYVVPRVKLEIGPLASWVPNDRYVIVPYLHDVFPELMKKYECTLKSIKAERTFWEKVTILHHEAHRPETSTVPLRYSRHYYDLAVPGTMKLIPSDHVLKFLKTDYREMRNMIFGEYPSFENIVQGLTMLEKEINSIKVK
ncbi:MAG TPA: nucleotidyl transferase AbiEii/AbiGii toxin family protein [bacterium]|nr:nucleotidyl transferase AbiEii/AbiGii toxin family protein [bacterium]